MCVCTCVYVSISVCSYVSMEARRRALEHFGVGDTGVFELLNVGGCCNLNSGPHNCVTDSRNSCTIFQTSIKFYGFLFVCLKYVYSLLMLSNNPL